MAQHSQAPTAPLTNAPGAAGAPDEHQHHPTAGTYIKVGAFLTAITVAEVWAYYIPSLVASRVFVPLLLIMSAVKFATVVAVYMHLKYDHTLFRSLFVGPFLIAATTMIGLMFLFGKLAVRLGLLN
jgi:cytochrome c oxidase subunit IV